MDKMCGGFKLQATTISCTSTAPAAKRVMYKAAHSLTVNMVSGPSVRINVGCNKTRNMDSQSSTKISIGLLCNLAKPWLSC